MTKSIIFLYGKLTRKKDYLRIIKGLFTQFDGSGPIIVAEYAGFTAAGVIVDNVCEFTNKEHLSKTTMEGPWAIKKIVAEVKHGLIIVTNFFDHYKKEAQEQIKTDTGDTHITILFYDDKTRTTVINNNIIDGINDFLTEERLNRLNRKWNIVMKK